MHRSPRSQPCAFPCSSPVEIAGYIRSKEYDLVYSTFSCALAFNLSQMDSILDLQQDKYNSLVLLLFNVQYRQVFPLLDPNMVCPQVTLTKSSTPRMNKNQMKVNKHNGLITVISWILWVAYIFSKVIQVWGFRVSTFQCLLLSGISNLVLHS